MADLPRPVIQSSSEGFRAVSDPVRFLAGPVRVVVKPECFERERTQRFLYPLEVVSLQPKKS